MAGDPDRKRENNLQGGFVRAREDELKGKIVMLAIQNLRKDLIFTRDLHAPC